jgi:phosphatidylinositol dimannoside acyltransferase
VKTDAPVEPVEEPPETERERLAYAAFASASWIAKRLPPRIGRALFQAAGSIAYRFATRLRATVTANQARVLGRPVDDQFVRANTREAFRRYARYWYDSFAIEEWDADDVRAGFSWTGDEHLFHFQEEGNGIIAVLPHLGNWDASARAMADRGLRMVAVAEHLRPERLFRLFVRQRERYGIEVIALDGHGGVGKALTSALAEGKLIGLLADRDLTGRGIEVEMFGARRRMPAGPALLAISTGAPVVVVGTYETPQGWRGIAWPLAMPELTGDRRTDATAITQAIAHAFERLISASPADWHVFEPAWPEDAG